MSWFDGPFLCVDTETTGVDITSARIVEAAWVHVTPDTVGPHYTAIVRPDDFDIPAEAAAIHGITTSKAMLEGRPAVEVITELVSAFGGPCPVVMFNARFDLSLILREAVRHGVEIGAVPLVLDPFVLDKALDQYRKGSRKLVDVAAHYGVELDESDAHGALADATAAGRVMFELLRRYPQLEDHTLTSMFVRQSVFAERQRASFVDYMRTQRDPGFDDPAGWPLLALTAVAS